MTTYERILRSLNRYTVETTRALTALGTWVTTINISIDEGSQKVHNLEEQVRALGLAFNQYKTETENYKKENDKFVGQLLAKVVVLEGELEINRKLTTRALKKVRLSSSSSSSLSSPTTLTVRRLNSSAESIRGSPTLPIVVEEENEENSVALPIVID